MNEAQTKPSHRREMWPTFCLGNYQARHSKNRRGRGKKLIIFNSLTFQSISFLEFSKHRCGSRHQGMLTPPQNVTFVLQHFTLTRSLWGATHPVMWWHRQTHYEGKENWFHTIWYEPGTGSMCLVGQFAKLKIKIFAVMREIRSR